MPRPPGLPKTGAREKGTQNKATRDLIEALEALGLDIPAQIVELLPQLSVEKRMDALLGLMPYMYPRRKPADQLLNTANPMTFVDYVKSVRAAQKARAANDEGSQDGQPTE